ncbi:unnamed protein product [Tuber aestivum]|uniref:Zinc finger H2C2-type histone UAS binding domain-containing protein n=1 Tax=Tuber aestivum TaxID=59557 RepID=A0A292PRE9_9PEZI|nr:unnamed protein product [Tuber aestivum]
MADQTATDHQRVMQHHQQQLQHQQTRDSLSSSPSRHSSTESILENPDAQVLPPPNPNPVLHPRSVYLRDHVSIATVHPVMHASQIPASLIAFLWTELNNEIERGDTYPIEEPMSLEKFTRFWFGTFGAVMLLGGKEEQTDLSVERDWSTQCLGTFYVKPNYPGETTELSINGEVRNTDPHQGRSSHICSAGFLTTFASRGKGCGKHLGEAYLDYAPKLGYTYSIFNLVYETNIASCKIWDSLGFKRIGKVKGAGRLSSSNYLVDAIIFGRDLNDDEDYVSDERFDKIRFYLEKGKYPPTADRSEKSRLRSAATHYKLENGKLMLKDKEVVSDGQMQYEIARSIHCQSHGGINKTTASIAEKFHWVRIKETVSQVIRNCAECKEHAKAPVVKGDRFNGSPVNSTPPQPQQQQQQQPQQPGQQRPRQQQQEQQQLPLSLTLPQQQLQQPQLQIPPNTQALLIQRQQQQQAAAVRAAAAVAAAQMDIPVDPAMMEDVQHTHHIPQQFAPVANMRMDAAPPPSHGPDNTATAAVTVNVNQTMGGTSAQASHQQRVAAVAAARAALGEGDVLTEEDRTMRDQHLMDRLMAEMKREPAQDMTVPFQEAVGVGVEDDDTAVARQLREDMEIER